MSFKQTRWLLWLVCAFLLIAAVDRLPDPPAISFEAAKTCSTAHDRQVAKPKIIRQLFLVALTAAESLPEQVSQVDPPAYLVKLAHQTTDNSPPLAA